LGGGLGAGFCHPPAARDIFAFGSAARAILVAILIAASAAHAGRGAADSLQVADPDPARFKEEIEAFEHWDRQNSFPQDAVLFVGSSSIRMWPTAERFVNLQVMNRGFGGSHISDVNHFAERVVLKYSPRMIVFYAGDNDIESGKSPQQVFDDFQAFAQLVHDRLPATRIIYLPIKPSVARWPKWPKMQDVNSRVEQLSKRDESIIYVDTATPMLGDDGKPRRELFLDDGLHLNETGYTLWTQTLGPVLERPAITPTRSVSEGRVR
jgi:lysophospholipase L1-like esterase